MQVCEVIKRVFTIGVYGKTEEQFFRRLTEARIDTFCDVRHRRGVRAAQYAFANSQRLQKALAARGIEYRHVLELAPSDDMRAAQYTLDAQQGKRQRTREELGEEFKERYCEEVLGKFDSAEFRRAFGSGSRFIVLFCVEAAAAACHRSLLAARLKKDWRVPIEHL